METSGKFRIVAAVCALIVGLSAPAPAKVIYVDDDAVGVNNGSSWADAFVYLQDALAVAQSGDEVRVAQGLYRPDQNARVATSHGYAVEISPSGLQTAAFQLRNGVAIKGGFAGVGAADPNARDVEQQESILSGDLYGNDIGGGGLGQPLYESLRQDNSLYVVESRSTDATAVLDGFTIQAAVQSGMYNRKGSPRVVNCIFRQNSAQRLSGGALLCEGGQPTLSNCVFRENSALVTGGAIDASTTRLTLSDCRFINNWAGILGGAISSVDTDLFLAGCTFEENAAQQGGAIYHQQGTIGATDCRFEGNLASKESGAVALCRQASASMTRCIFWKNWTADLGGAISNGGEPLILEACTFSGNQAKYGGAVRAFEEFPRNANLTPHDVVVTRCIFTGNRASLSGGALYSDRAELQVMGCTFADNQARIGTALGRALRQPGDTAYPVLMENCILWDGKGPIGYPFPAGGQAQGKEPEVVVRYSDIQSGWPGEGNIDADPCFAAPGHWVDASNPVVSVKPDYPGATWIDGDYHLKSQAGRWDPASGGWILDAVTSPCIDAGDPASPVAEEPQPNGGRINLGAYGGTAEASKSLKQ